jgi:hypothetical protein
MKRFLYYFLTLSFVCGVACAQEPAAEPAKGLGSYMETGMEVTGIRAPYYDDEGNLKAQLYGDFAKVVEGGVADITNLQIDIYQDGEIMMTIFAPQCFSKVVEPDGDVTKRAFAVYSDGDVLIDMDAMTIAGRGFEFTSENNRFTIHHDSKVLVKRATPGMRGVEL